jgi:hypothetical protein
MVSVIWLWPRISITTRAGTGAALHPRSRAHFLPPGCFAPGRLRGRRRTAGLLSAARMPQGGRLPRYGNGARLRADCPVEDRRARPAIPRSMSFYDTCVAPRYRNGPTGRRRLTGAEAFELEGMDPCYIDIDRFWPKGADSKGPESVPIAN